MSMYVLAFFTIKREEDFKRLELVPVNSIMNLLIVLLELQDYFWCVKSYGFLILTTLKLFQKLSLLAFWCNSASF